jgi:hypothetical protein
MGPAVGAPSVFIGLKYIFFEVEMMSEFRDWGLAVGLAGTNFPSYHDLLKGWFPCFSQINTDVSWLLRFPTVLHRYAVQLLGLRAHCLPGLFLIYFAFCHGLTVGMFFSGRDVKDFEELCGLEKGDFIGVACDVEKGTMQVSINGGMFVTIFSSGVSTGPAIGSDLFPIVAGARKMKVRLNFGTDPFQPFRYAPPSSVYLAECLRATAESCILKVRTNFVFKLKN